MVRSFVDPLGRAWQVWNVAPSRKSDLFLPATMADGWLCFECADEKRRLHPVPPGWEELPEAELWPLAQTAQPVQRRPAQHAATEGEDDA
ncbi:MAG TPA: hypothetical protein VFQ45_13710 [Longimicrobium sp.]|nr:hypothetical protein [Longimicrobium sp.]